MGQARRRELARRAFAALPPHLQQPPLPALLCACLRPGWDGSGALALDDFDEGYGHVYCNLPWWLTDAGQARARQKAGGGMSLMSDARQVRKEIRKRYAAAAALQAKYPDGIPADAPADDIEALEMLIDEAQVHLLLRKLAKLEAQVGI